MLDLLLTNEEGMVSNLKHESPLGKSDHCTLVYEFNCRTEVTDKSYTKFYYDRGDYEALEMDIDWKTKLDLHRNDPGKQWVLFKTCLQEAQLRHIPSKHINTHKKKRSGVPIDRKTFQATKKKHRMWQRYIETRDPVKYKEYTRQRNKVRSMTRKLQRDLEKDVSKQAKTNPKKFWNYVKRKMKTSTGVSDLVIRTEGSKEILTRNNQQKAQTLSDFFGSVFTREPDTEIPVLEDISVDSQLDNLEVTKEEVIQKLRKLKIDKSPGPDAMHPRLLKELAVEIGTALETIFNSTVTNGTIPEDWKQAQITAIFKKGNRKSPCNYRPVSLTCVVCKVMESIVRDRIISHMKQNKLFSNRQYGFIGGRSTALQLLKVLDAWTEILDQGGEIDVIYLDFMKAFDTVPHIGEPY